MTISKLVSEKMYNTIIETCYSTDNELLSKYHAIAPASLEECIAHTIDTFAKAKNFEMYEIHHKNKFVGYFGIETYVGVKYICGFFLMPEYRNPKFKRLLLDEVIKIGGDRIGCLLYKKNTRAIKFFVKHGFEKKQMNNDIVYLFLD